MRACSVQGAACSRYVLAAARAWVHGSARVRADCGLQQDSMGSQMLHCRFQRLFELLDVDTAAFELLAILLEHCTCGVVPGGEADECIFCSLFPITNSRTNQSV